MFFLGQKSEHNLTGVDERLCRVVRRAITLTTVDFTVFEGLRSQERQAQLYREGVSRTLNSYHLTGHAVDLVPWIAGRAQWQAPACVQVAIAVRLSALHFDIEVTWGAVWDKPLNDLDPTELEREVRDYVIRYQVKNGVKKYPLIDYPHFQVSR
jgi:peptidoglycan L-alanyl-D-glutamate endopeptidase CwlK